MISQYSEMPESRKNTEKNEDLSVMIKILFVGASFADERRKRINTVFLRKEAKVYTPFTPLKVNSQR